MKKVDVQFGQTVWYVDDYNYLQSGCVEEVSRSGAFVLVRNSHGFASVSLEKCYPSKDGALTARYEASKHSQAIRGFVTVWDEK